MKIAIVAALPGELKQLVNTGFKKCATQQQAVHKWIGGTDEDEWVAVCAGIGADAARRAFAEAEADGKIDIVLSVGWAGALIDDLNPGSTYIPSIVIDAQTGERFMLADGKRKFVLATIAAVAQQDEKLRLAKTYDGVLVDMESATILRLAQMRGIPACCMKAVSDGLNEELPNFNQFIDSQGQMKMVSFLGHVLLRPRFWKSLIHLGKASARGSHTLASCILTFLTGPKDIAAVNRTGNVDW